MSEIFSKKSLKYFQPWCLSSHWWRGSPWLSVSWCCSPLPPQPCLTLRSTSCLLTTDTPGQAEWWEPKTSNLSRYDRRPRIIKQFPVSFNKIKIFSKTYIIFNKLIGRLRSSSDPVPATIWTGEASSPQVRLTCFLVLRSIRMIKHVSGKMFYF